MKKIFVILIIASAFAVTSCSTVKKSATTRNIAPAITAAVLSDLEVSNQKVTYTLYPTAEVRRGGLQNCIETAVSEALAANGGDVLVETQTAVVELNPGRKVKSVTVTGYPAKYKNFRQASEETLNKMAVSDAGRAQNTATRRFSLKK